MSCSVTFRLCSAGGKVGWSGQLELPLWSTQPRCRRCWHVESQQLRFPTSSLPAFLANTCAGGSGPRLSASLCGGSQQPAEPATAESQKTKMPWTPQHSASWLDHFGKQRSGALQALKLKHLTIRFTVFALSCTVSRSCRGNINADRCLVASEVLRHTGLKYIFPPAVALLPSWENQFCGASACHSNSCWTGSTNHGIVESHEKSE